MNGSLWVGAGCEVGGEKSGNALVSRAHARAPGAYLRNTGVRTSRRIWCAEVVLSTRLNRRAHRFVGRKPRRTAKGSAIGPSARTTASAVGERPGTPGAHNVGGAMSCVTCAAGRSDPSGPRPATALVLQPQAALPLNQTACVHEGSLPRRPPPRPGACPAVSSVLCPGPRGRKQSRGLAVEFMHVEHGDSIS